VGEPDLREDKHPGHGQDHDGEQGQPPIRAPRAGIGSANFTVTNTTGISTMSLYAADLTLAAGRLDARVRLAVVVELPAKDTAVNFLAAETSST
jgi:hypothetical protein